MATRSWNRVELIGNLTRDPEVRFTPQGTPVATFSIATNRTYISDGERKEEADFHRIVAWSKLAELCGQLLKKGNRVFVSGRLQNRSWEAADGQNRQTTEIVIEDMILLTQRDSAGGGGYNEDFNEDVTPNESKAVSFSKPQTPPRAKSDDNKVLDPVVEEETKDDNEEKNTEEVEDKKKSSKVTEVVEDLDDLPF